MTNVAEVITETDIKCVVWDLDHTLWSGVLMEDGDVYVKPEIITIIQTLDKRGILQSIASKNDYDLAMQKLDAFGLKDYFLYPKINWNAKSHSIAQIREALNFGIDTFAFIDDQAFERDEVQSIHPEVLTVDAIDAAYVLTHTRFNPRFITEDSARRRAMYQSDIVRNNEESVYNGPKDKFLASLDMKFTLSEATTADLQRAEELTIRTNQLNATGKTYDYHELDFYRKSPDHKLYVCELTDKYGSYGKIGLALVEEQEQFDYLKLLLMSCRVISRGVGTVLLSFLMKRAKQHNKLLRADFRKTGRNDLMYITYKFANFREVEQLNEHDYVLENDISYVQNYPDFISVCEPKECM